MKKKIRVALIFGGKSAEHEVSLQSARNVSQAIDKNKYEVVLIGIDKEGHWHLNDGENFLLHGQDPKEISLDESTRRVILMPHNNSGRLMATYRHEDFGKIDVVFPILHGTYGEDGTIQGLLKLFNLPFVGPSVLGSAVGMDKDVFKRLLRDAKIPVAKFLVFNKTEKKSLTYFKIAKILKSPFFVKPANLGSSVGIHKIHNEKEFNAAIDDAFSFDNKIIFEEYIKGRELECAVLGNENPVASLIGEVIPKHEFYSYSAKYLDENGAILKIPTKLPEATVKKIQGLAIDTFLTAGCEGLARVDFFMDEKGKIYVNEINTIPGFTNISMYPKLWEATGIGYSELIDKLIELAIERFERDNKLRTSVDPEKVLE